MSLIVSMLRKTKIIVDKWWLTCSLAFEILFARRTTHRMTTNILLLKTCLAYGFFTGGTNVTTSFAYLFRANNTTEKVDTIFTYWLTTDSAFYTTIRTQHIIAYSTFSGSALRTDMWITQRAWSYAITARHLITYCTRFCTFGAYIIFAIGTFARTIVDTNIVITYRT